MPIPPELFTNVYAIATEGKLAELDHARFEDFVVQTVNGDTPMRHIAFGARLDEEKDGAIVYLLTNRRLIKITINPPEFKSSATFVSQIVGGVNRKIISRQAEKLPDLIWITINFPQGSFGLKYSTEDHEITNFFQEVDSVIGQLVVPR
jgi:hypothetical protein